jgi:hypothetical protein
LVDFNISQDTFDNKHLVLPNKLTIQVFTASRNDSILNNTLIINKANIVKDIYLGTLSGSFKREGFFFLKTHLTYPQYLIIPEYSDQRQNDFYYYIIDNTGKVQIIAKGRSYIGRIPETLVKTLKNLYARK